MNTGTKLLPLMVTACPEPSMVVLNVRTRGFVKVMVPSHAKVTEPPPARAANKLVSSQLETVPAACAKDAGKVNTNKAKTAIRCLCRILYIPFLAFGVRLS